MVGLICWIDGIDYGMIECWDVGGWFVGWFGSAIVISQLTIGLLSNKRFEE
jgi:hypothetical protein